MVAWCAACRCVDAGDVVVAVDVDNPLPGFIDPITLEPVLNPALSPYGHVMGLATWRAVLAEHKRCPFTKQVCVCVRRAWRLEGGLGGTHPATYHTRAHTNL